MKTHFIDQTEVLVGAGHGGRGMVSFRTARNKPKLGPDGGNGGVGGDVVVVADHQINTLSRFRYRQTYKAEDGGKGGTGDKTGRSGEELIIPVPLGTVLYDVETGDCLGEIVEADDRLMVAKGGKRGYGNTHYMLATRQAPHFSTEGEKGESRRIKLELKLLADVGLAGLPNAGKSTLLSVLSAARPKIADYPFTTLVPNLGVVDFGAVDSVASFVMADIPGLIEGAAQGKGLGLDFLRHIERTKVIAFVIDCFPIEGWPENESPWTVYQKLRKELQSYSEGLLQKSHLIVLTKMDLAPSQEEKDQLRQPFVEAGLDPIWISSASQENLQDLKWQLYRLVQNQPPML
jgi:GTP-binding protein